jgi:hypothetical protein
MTRRVTVTALLGQLMLLVGAASYDELVLASSPALYAPLANTSTTSSDSNRFTLAFTPSPSSWHTTVLPNKELALLFANTSSVCVLAPNVAAWAGLTLEAWIQPALPVVEDDWAKFITQDPYSCGLYVASVGCSLNATQVLLVAEIGAPSWPSESWTHFAVVVQENFTALLYLNGTRRKALDLLSPPTTIGLGSTAPLCIGTTFHGSLAKVAIYPAALAAATFEQHFQAMLAPPLDPGKQPDELLRLVLSFALFGLILACALAFEAYHLAVKKK